MLRTEAKNNLKELNHGIVFKMFLQILPYQVSFFLFAVLEFELRALHLLGR
jgi:hypothetical protein